MKELSKLKIKEFVEMTDKEMKNIAGGRNDLDCEDGTAPCYMFTCRYHSAGLQTQLSGTLDQYGTAVSGCFTAFGNNGYLTTVALDYCC